jgi:hypothetical protein
VGTNLLLGVAVVGIVGGHLTDEHPATVERWFLVAAICAFYILEATVLRGHLNHVWAKLEERVYEQSLSWIDPESKYDNLL